MVVRSRALLYVKRLQSFVDDSRQVSRVLMSILPRTKSEKFHPKCEQHSSVFLPSTELQRPVKIPYSVTERTSVLSDTRHEIIKDA